MKVPYSLKHEVERIEVRLEEKKLKLFLSHFSDGIYRQIHRISYNDTSSFLLQRIVIARLAAPQKSSVDGNLHS
jgi:hypothetical protein